MHRLTFQLTSLRYSDRDVIHNFAIAIFSASFITLIDFVRHINNNLPRRHSVVWWRQGEEEIEKDFKNKAHRDSTDIELIMRKGAI